MTAEVSEEFLNELVQLRARVKTKNEEVITQMRSRSPWLKRDETIPYEVAHRFIQKTAWWLTHSSGRPVRAPGHADRIRRTHHGWEVDFGANSFLVGKAIERCRNRIDQFFQDITASKSCSLDDLKDKLKIDISGAVANCNGDEYEGFYPITGSDLVFGAQAIDVNDGVRFFLEEINFDGLFL